MATNADLGYGTLLARNGTTVAEVLDISGPGLSRASVDATHQQSPDMWLEAIKGMKDGGEVSFEINYYPTGSTHNASTGLLSDFANDSTIDTWTITFPNGTVWSFPGFVTSFEPSAPVQDKFTASVTLKVAGKPTLA